MKRLSAFPCVLAFVVLVALSVTGCGAAAQDPKAPVGFTTSQTYITIENRSGNALAEGLIELVPSGVLAPFRRELPRMESGAKRDVSYDLFSGAGGSRFRPGVTRIKSVRITAKDVSGKTYKVEAPFN
ncbi:MAG TPA: hypothetical protein VFS23_01915 [Vicinamibacterales bacterium]|jgi:hypothetical protein|nr:hypothetical protein [Vicinamibacterales bacterium]